MIVFPFEVGVIFVELTEAVISETCISSISGASSIASASNRLIVLSEVIDFRSGKALVDCTVELLSSTHASRI